MKWFKVSFQDSFCLFLYDGKYNSNYVKAKYFYYIYIFLYDHARTRLLTPVFIQACYHRRCKTLYDELKILFDSFSSVLITNTLIMFFYKRSTRDILHQPLLVSVYRHLRDRNENQLRKDFCRIRNACSNHTCAVFFNDRP